MPKTIITQHIIHIILGELDKWKGKLTWNLFCKHLSSVLGETHLSRHTLIKYTAIKVAFDERKKSLKDSVSKEKVDDVTLELLLRENEMLRARNQRLQQQIYQFQEQFVRWLENLRRMPGVDMVTLNTKIDQPLPKISRK